MPALFMSGWKLPPPPQSPPAAAALAAEQAAELAVEVAPQLVEVGRALVGAACLERSGRRCLRRRAGRQRGSLQMNSLDAACSPMLDRLGMRFDSVRVVSADRRIVARRSALGRMRMSRSASSWGRRARRSSRSRDSASRRSAPGPRRWRADEHARHPHAFAVRTRRPGAGAARLERIDLVEHQHLRHVVRADLVQHALHLADLLACAAGWPRRPRAAAGRRRPSPAASRWNASTSPCGRSRMKPTVSDSDTERARRLAAGTAGAWWCPAWRTAGRPRRRRALTSALNSVDLPALV